MKKKKKCVLPIFAPPPKKSEFSKFHTRRYHAWRVQNLKEICFFGNYLYFDIKIWTRLIWYQARESLKNNKFWKKKKSQICKLWTELHAHFVQSMILNKGWSQKYRELTNPLLLVYFQSMENEKNAPFVIVMWIKNFLLRVIV